MLKNTLEHSSENLAGSRTIKKNTQTRSGIYPAFISENFPPEMQLLLYSIGLRRNIEVDKRIKNLLASELNWENFVTSALRHSTVPLIYKTLGKFSEYVPKNVLQSLKSLNQNNVFNNIYLTNELLKMLSLLELNGITALPHKGPVLAAIAYGDISLRQFCDLDILVDKKDVLKIKELFGSIRYFPLHEKTAEQDQNHIDSSRPYNYKFLSENKRVAVELHWMFTSKYNSFPVDYEHLMKNLSRFEIAGKIVPALKTEDLLVILCQHGSKHFWSRLQWISDIAVLIEKYPNLDWRHVTKFSRKIGAERMLFLGLRLSQTLLNAAPPSEISKQIETDRTVKKLANRIIKQIASDAENSIKDFEAHKFSCQMRERWRDKVVYSAYRLLPQFKRVSSLMKKIKG